MPHELGLLLGPNPASGPVTIHFDLPRDEWVSVCVFDGVGHRVATLVRGLETRGAHEVSWDGSVDGERRAGTYFCRVTADNKSCEGDVLLLR